MDFRPLIEEQDTDIELQYANVPLSPSPNPNVNSVSDGVNNATLTSRLPLIAMGGLVIAGPVGAIVGVKIGIIAGVVSSICGFIAGSTIIAKVSAAQ